MKTSKLSKTTKAYQKALNVFRKQYKDVQEITRLYVNSDNKVFAGEWIDSEGIINFNGGYAPDTVKTIIIK